MWSSDARRLRGLAWSIVLLSGLALSGCTGLRPVYGDAGLTAQRVDVQYAKPNSRLEQVIYQELALKLGKSSGSVPTVSVAVSQGSRDLTNNIVTRPHDQREMIVTAQITVTSPDGEVLFSGARSQAAEDAALRAARLLADTVRLQVLAALAN
jgi:LPS-assembly lipoprotein